MSRIMTSGTDAVYWVISVGGYGSFFFEGTEEQAEKMRCLKARWEQAVARKRLATAEELMIRILRKCPT
mgnify:CR=1 FL=1